MKKLLALSFLLFMGSCAAYLFDPHRLSEAPSSEVRRASEGGHFPLYESWSPVNDLGMFLFVFAASIPLVIVIIKLVEWAERQSD